MKKRIISLVLALLLCASLAAPVMAADSDFVIAEDGRLTQYTGPGGDVVIPFGVESIWHGVFENNTSITSVTIPDSVTYIGGDVFKGCANLKSVVLPNSVCEFYTSGDGLFYGCVSLTEVTIPYQTKNNMPRNIIIGVLVVAVIAAVVVLLLVLKKKKSVPAAVPTASQAKPASEVKPEPKQTEAFKFCPKCGTKVPIDTAYCPKCGKPLENGED